MLKIHLLVFCTLVIRTFTQDSYVRVLNQIDPEAVCLDGTRPVLYHHKGSEKNKFLIYFPGGGVCSGTTQAETIEDCYQRSFTQMGSSSFWP